MGKAKTKTPGIFVPQRHLHSRISYLYQAARYLETTTRHSTQSRSKVTAGHSRHLVNQLQGVASRSQIRLASSVKHTICKRCQGILEEGSSLSSFVKNDSKEGKKPWADVLVRECKTCGASRRFPIGAKRQKRRDQRSHGSEDENKKDAIIPGTGEGSS